MLALSTQHALRLCGMPRLGLCLPSLARQRAHCTATDQADGMTDGNVIDISDYDQRIFDARLSGASVRVIARQFRCSAREVEAIIARMVTPVNLETKLRELQLDLDRIGQLLATYLPKGVDGDHDAAAIALKILDHKARLL